MYKCVMPAGKYFVGDPSMVLNSNSWQEIILATDTFCDEDADWRNLPIWAAATAHGDGAYDGSDGFEYPVYRGLIGVMPVEAMDVEVDLVEHHMNGRIVEFDEGFICEEFHGIITIGEISIDTDPENDEEVEFHSGYDY